MKIEAQKNLAQPRQVQREQPRAYFHEELTKHTKADERS